MPSLPDLETVTLVRGDQRPFVTVGLTGLDGVSAFDLSQATSVTMYFRSVDDPTVLSTLTCTIVDDGSGGLVRFNFPGSTLDVEPGFYEGEFEVLWPGNEKQTAYRRLKFRVREQFA